MTRDPVRDTPFDAYAGAYDAALQQGLAASGEDRDYFAQGRIAWLARHLQRRGIRPQRVLDFGCGTGAAVPHLRRLGAGAILGVDPSAGSLQVARERHGNDAEFRTPAEAPPAGGFDLAFCNGVFHHIPPEQRDGALKYVFDSLSPGGMFAFWENNPWNPGTRYVMSRIPFDRDAMTISAPAARRLLRKAGFQVLATHFLFIFPRFLALLRPFERPLAALPFGAQYQVFCRRA